MKYWFLALLLICGCESRWRVPPTYFYGDTVLIHKNDTSNVDVVAGSGIVVNMKESMGTWEYEVMCRDKRFQLREHSMELLQRFNWDFKGVPKEQVQAEVKEEFLEGIK